MKIMVKSELKDLVKAITIDARGTPCPGPVMEVMKAIRLIHAGEVIEILSSDEGTRCDLPKWCMEQGHEYVGYIKEKGYFKIYIRK